MSITLIACRVRGSTSTCSRPGTYELYAAGWQVYPMGCPFDEEGGGCVSLGSPYPNPTSITFIACRAIASTSTTYMPMGWVFPMGYRFDGEGGLCQGVCRYTRTLSPLIFRMSLRVMDLVFLLG